MELIERAGFLASLQTKFENIAEGEGHCVLLSGEAGMGKTSLLKAFCNERKKDCKIYQGTCDALFTPRPLAPLHDIIWQIKSDLWENSLDIEDRAGLFTRFFQELGNQKGPTLIVFEDIHWADEATLDFIKFLARRITHVQCLFILTYRNDEIHSRHPLRNVLGQLPPDSFTRLDLLPLSRQAVEKMATEKGYSGEDVYSISGGNPFYVNEILASYSSGIPDNIKDSILSVYNRQDEKTRHIWEILSVLPTGCEIKYLEQMEPLYAAAVQNCLDSKILIPQEGRLFFKHELYRRTIEASLSPLVRVALNKKILDLFLDKFEQNEETERIIHHAKNANEYDLVVQYVPAAAKKAAGVGAHIEASNLYLSAIENYHGNDLNVQVQLYEAYAYECYLINRTKESINYQEKLLEIWKKKNDTERIGDCLRFLSRLWWFEGNHENSQSYARKAVELLDSHSSSRAKAMAYSNMSQLMMLSSQAAECIFWGEKAIGIANEMNDEEILCHALNNVGTVQIGSAATKQKGLELLQQSLDISLNNSYHEHAARAYTNLASNSVELKDYAYARETLEAGIQYCEKRDLDSWTTYMLAYKAMLNLETGLWNEAYCIADSLIKTEHQPPIVMIGALAVVATIKMRKGHPDALPMLLDAKSKAFMSMELQRIIPVMLALLEYEWITGKHILEKEDIDFTIRRLEQTGCSYENEEFAFWLLKARKQHIPLWKVHDGYKINIPKITPKSADMWEKLGCPYEHALTLFEGSDIDKRNAITIIHRLGATAVYEKMKMEMRMSGIRSIPRGIRESTRANPAHLTERELDVLRLLKESMQNKEIAEKLYISAKTVDHHISSILLKLNVNSRVKAVREAFDKGIII